MAGYNEWCHQSQGNIKSDRIEYNSTFLKWIEWKNRGVCENDELRNRSRRFESWEAMLHFLLSITSYILHILPWRARQKSAVRKITECVIYSNEMETIPLKLCSTSTKIQAFQGQILYEAAQIWSTLSILLLLSNFLHHLRGTKCCFKTCAFFLE